MLREMAIYKKGHALHVSTLRRYLESSQPESRSGKMDGRSLEKGKSGEMDISEDKGGGSYKGV